MGWVVILMNLTWMIRWQGTTKLQRHFSPNAAILCYIQQQMIMFWLFHNVSVCTLTQQISKLSPSLIECLYLLKTSSSAVAERLRDALCPSVVSFNSVIPWAQSFIIVISASVHLPVHTSKSCCCLWHNNEALVIQLVIVSRQKQTPLHTGE